MRTWQMIAWGLLLLFAAWVVIQVAQAMEGNI